MSSAQFSFPPESYSAVYKSEGSADANVVNGNPCDACVTSVLPSEGDTSPTLFSCFHCAFRTSIKAIRKEKHRKDKHGANNRAIKKMLALAAYPMFYNRTPIE